jgi:HSP20 family protein
MNKKRDRDLPAERQPDRRWVVQGYMVWRPNSRFTPPTDVIELADRMIVLVEIAGMRASDFNVALFNHRLIITGTRERPSIQGAYHQVEIGYGEFRVELMLPWQVEQDEVSASYREGFLQVELPRRPERAIRVVDVTTVEERDDDR